MSTVAEMPKVAHTRPSRATRKPGSKRNRVGVEELERRRKAGLGLWDGKPLSGLDYEEWFLLECGMEDSSEYLALIKKRKEEARD